jgi:hypothetical protein
MVTPTDPISGLLGNLFGNKGKSLEKFMLYVLGVLSGTNVFGTVHQGNARYWLTLAIGLVLHGLHSSTPTPKSGPGQL